MICLKCESELDEGDKFCRNCGEKVSKENFKGNVEASDNVIFDNSVSKNTDKTSTLDFKCEHCRKIIRTKDRNAEQLILCPNCGKEVKVPTDLKGCLGGCLVLVVISIILSFIISSCTGEEERGSATGAYPSKYKEIDIAQEVSKAHSKIIGSPKFEVFTTKGNVTIMLDKPLYFNDLVFISSAYLKLFSRNDEIDRVYIDYYLPGMTIGETTYATAAYYKDSPESFTLSMPYWEQGKFILDDVTFEGWGKRTEKEIKADKYITSGVLLNKHYKAYSEYINQKDKVNEKDLLSIISDKYGFEFNPIYYKKRDVEDSERLNKEFGGEFIAKDKMTYKDGKYAYMDIIEAYNLLSGYTYE